MNTHPTHRYSKQRARILEVLRSTTEHPTANWVYDNVRKEIPNISLGTVYRNLSVLCDDGVVIKIDVGDGTERYDAYAEPHYHLHCKKCGCVCDICSQYEDAIDRKAEKESGCRIDYHSLLFNGICPDCSADL